jgi:integrase
MAAEIYELLNAAQRDRTDQLQQKHPLLVPELRAISLRLAKTGKPQAILERTIIVLAFATALRRSSVAALMLTDIEFVTQGLVVHVRREKQDQLGRGRMIGVPYAKHPETCATRCLREWIEIRGEKPGRLFIHTTNHRPIRGDWVNVIVQRNVKALGLNPSDYGAHSLRAGFVTAAGEAGLGDLIIAAQTGHRDLSVLRQYFRRTELFRGNAAAMIGL